jgi:D-alanyl-D-alanine carboxypeptidase/D-alanyl-D-alanine-endopeptidase (penicillin-binding protein 4)
VPDPHQTRGEVSDPDSAEGQRDPAGSPSQPATLSGNILTDDEPEVHAESDTPEADSAESEAMDGGGDPGDPASEDDRQTSRSGHSDVEQEETSEAEPEESAQPQQSSEEESEQGEAGAGSAEAAAGEQAESPAQTQEPATSDDDDWPTDVQARIAPESSPDAGTGQRSPAQWRGHEAPQSFRDESPAEETTRIARIEAPVSSDTLRTRIPEDSGPPTARIQAIRAPMPETAEEQTQRFARPDFDAAPGLAHPSDFAGVTEQQVPESAAALPPETPETGTAVRKRHRRGRFLIVVAAVAVVGLGVWLSTSVGPFRSIVATTAAPAPPVRLDPAFKPLADSGPIPTPQGLSAALAGPVSNPALGTLGGIVFDAKTGQTLWQQNATEPLTPASNGKLLAMSAAMLVLNHQSRFVTKVVQGAQPGSVVLVGGGDPTLSSLPDGQQSMYPGAAHLDDLVAQVRAATGGHVTSIQVDTSRYVGPTMAPGWDPSDIGGGSITQIQPVMLDGGRFDPTNVDGARTPTPALTAGQVLAQRLGLPPTAVSMGNAPAGSKVLGQVYSPTIQNMVETLLQQSDNVLAEAITRQVAIATGQPASFSGGVTAVRDVLQRNGFSLAGVNMVDGCGLSVMDRIPPKVLGTLMETANAPAGPDGQLPTRTAQMRSLLPGLPVAGGTGTLAERYQGSPARGWIRAKTGTLNGANGLEGNVVTRDGRLLVFDFISNGTGSAAARPALDAIAETLWGCGCR